MANPNVRRTERISSNMDRIARSKDLIEHDLVEIAKDQRVAHRHCTCAARDSHVAGATGAERQAMLAMHALHDANCSLRKLMRKELELIEELRQANAALEAGAPIEVAA